MVDGKPVLLDLYEMGLTNGFIETQIQPIDSYVVAAQVVNALTVEEQLLLAQKLTEIHLISPRAALFLSRGLQEFAWQILDVDLNVIDEQSPLKIETVQLANRLGSIIRLQKSYWDKMSPTNRVALVLHEVVYAYAPVVLIPRDFDADFDQGFIYEQDSVPVREFIGILFLELTERTRYLKEVTIIQMWGSAKNFSFLNGDRVETMSNVRVKGGWILNITKPSLCEELLLGNVTYPKTVELTFKRTSEKMIVESYNTASGRQKNLDAYFVNTWESNKITLNLYRQDVFTCTEQVKDAISALK
jgi:hypothetical protein